MKIFKLFWKVVRLWDVNEGTDQRGCWRWRGQASKQMGSQSVCLTKWARQTFCYIWGSSVSIFPPLPIAFWTTCSRHTGASGGQNDDCRCENSPDSKSSFYFPDAVWPRCEFITQNKLQSSLGGYHSIANLELLDLQCLYRGNPVDAGNPMGVLHINRGTPRAQGQLVGRTQESGHAGSGNVTNCN